jgi:hypothetical protein
MRTQHVIRFRIWLSKNIINFSLSFRTKGKLATRIIGQYRWDGGKYRWDGQTTGSDQMRGLGSNQTKIFLSDDDLQHIHGICRSDWNVAQRSSLNTLESSQLMPAVGTCATMQ